MPRGLHRAHRRRRRSPLHAFRDDLHLVARGARDGSPRQRHRPQESGGRGLQREAGLVRGLRQLRRAGRLRQHGALLHPHGLALRQHAGGVLRLHGDGRPLPVGDGGGAAVVVHLHREVGRLGRVEQRPGLVRLVQRVRVPSGLEVRLRVLQAGLGLTAARIVRRGLHRRARHLHRLEHRLRLRNGCLARGRRGAASGKGRAVRRLSPHGGRCG
ncbi:hypothetical protein D7X30_39765 [Corallococcus sp. AB011P]|nr:hypothetical protein D7X30_39765 [Corallococcus sp. AB011P]